MRGTNRKTVLVVLLCIAILVLGAMLPMFLADIHERRFAPGFAAMSSVELQLRDSSALGLKDKFSLVSNSTNTLEVNEEVASRTAGEILELAESQLQPYLDANLILAPDLDVSSQAYFCQPYLTVSEGEMVVSVVVWQVLIQFDEEEYPLVLAIDDQTGVLVSLDYRYSKTDLYDMGEDYFVPDQNIDALIEIFLSGLGEEFTEYMSAAGNHKYSGGTGTNGQSWTISWEGDFGLVGLEFHAWPYGLNVDIF